MSAQRAVKRQIWVVAALLAAWGCTSTDAAQTTPWEGSRASASLPDTPDAGPEPLPTRVSFGEHVLPILRRRGCVTCHGPGLPLGGLDVSTVAALLSTGDHAPVVIPCDPNASVLIQKVRQEPPFGETMPPPAPLYGPDGAFEPETPGPLTEREFAILQLWVLGGGDPTACAPRPDPDAGPTDADLADADPTDADTAEDVPTDAPEPPRDVEPSDAPLMDAAPDVPGVDAARDVAADPDVSVEEEPFVLRFEELEFERDILPWMNRNRCVSCHGGIAGYYADSYNDVVNSGLRAPHVIPCDPDASTLLRKVLPTGPYPSGGRMPTRSPYVSADDVQILRQWIAEGAQRTYTPGFCD